MGPFRDSDDWQEPAKLQDWVPAAYARRAFWRGAMCGGGFIAGMLYGRDVLQWWFA
jgi:hypothetical protein